MQVQRLNVVAAPTKLQPTPASAIQRLRRLHSLHRNRFAVECPLIKIIERRVVLDDAEFRGLLVRGASDRPKRV